ncbi:putative proton-dependent oligopeptide transporter family, MFS transporter superfamily [Helianthus debilis subsp. tardiflorus]
MMNYLTDVWNLSVTHAAGIINIFNGITPALAIVFAFFADTFLGDFYMLVFSCIAYSIGLGFLSLSTPTVFGPCRQYKEECIGHTQKVLFFTALPLIAVGQAGQHASLASFIGLQNDDEVVAAVEARQRKAVAKAQRKAEAENAAEALIEPIARREAIAKARREAEAEAEPEPEAATEAQHEAADEDRAKVEPSISLMPDVIVSIEQAGQLASLESFTGLQNEAEAASDSIESFTGLQNEAEAASDSLESFTGLQNEAEAASEVIADVQIDRLVMFEGPPIRRKRKATRVKDGGEAEPRISITLPKMIVVLVTIGGGIALPYIKPWSIRFGIPAICATTATVLFLTGSKKYKRHRLQGSPLTIPLRVFVAAATKHFQQVTSFKKTYRSDDDDDDDNDARTTKSLRCLGKAAIKYPDQALSKSWTLCSVREVEDTNTGLRLVPMLLTVVVTGLMLSLGNTYFLEQANHMDHKLGSIKINISIFLLFHMISYRISKRILNALLVNCVPIPKRYYAPTRIGVGMVLSVLCCVTAATVETRRLHVIRNHGLLDKSNVSIPMSVFSMLPQFLLLGAVDGITNSGIKSFLRDEVPASMHMSLFKNFIHPSLKSLIK